MLTAIGDRGSKHLLYKDMSIWKVYAKKADFKAVWERFGVDQVIARIIRNRDITDSDKIEEYLYGNLDNLYSPFLMKGMYKATGLIKDAIEHNKHIRIIGDYDIDGICSIYILHTGLVKLGAYADYVVPDRITDGYGINERLIRNAREDGVDMILTCDNGIAAADEVRLARELGITVIVTDHHDVPFRICDDATKVSVLPEADAIINPKQDGCEYPCKELCGAAVAWKLIHALIGENIRESRFLQSLLEFAAIATVGDIVELLGENRTIVKCGLRHIHQGTPNIGLRELMKVCGIQEDEFSEYHIGFVAGPCLNASGRLGSADRAIGLLESKDEAEANEAAQYLKTLNDERREITDRGVEAAICWINDRYGNDIPDVLVIYLKDCHESVAGIIAGRIREQFYRPTIVFTQALGYEGMLKGSGRSIDNYNMFEKISEVSELLDKFGGHPMAAGMSIKSERLENFRELLNARAKLTQEDFTPVLWIDVPMPVEYVQDKLIAQLAVLEPFGKGNPRPVFADRNLTVISKRIMGSNGNVIKMQLVSQSGHKVEAVRFRATQNEIADIREGINISMVYYPVVNEYNGRRSIQFNIIEMHLQ